LKNGNFQPQSIKQDSAVDGGPTLQQCPALLASQHGFGKVARHNANRPHSVSFENCVDLPEVDWTLIFWV